MRTFVCTLVILGVLIGGIAVYEVVLVHQEKEFDLLVQGMKKAIAEREESQADDYISQMEEKWDSSKNMLMAFSEHQDLDDTEERLKNLRSAYLYKDWQEMYKELEVFSMLLKNGFQSSKPTLTNIL